MIRVLHLLPHNPDFQTQRSAELLARDLGPDFNITARTLGTGGDFRNAVDAWLGLRGGDHYDVIHAWGERALIAATLSSTGRTIFSPPPLLRTSSIRWLRAAMAYRDVQVVCATATQRRLCISRGISPERCHLIRPGVDFARVRRRRDPQLRRKLGIVEDDHVLLAPGESTRASAHEHAVWTTSILHVLDPRYKLLVWGRGERARRAAAMGHRLGQPGLVKVGDNGKLRDFEELLPAADTVLVTARGAVATLPIAITMAAALPIVSSVTYTVAELLEDRHTALMVPKLSPRLLAQRVLDLRADSGLVWSISDMARTEAYEYFALTRFMNQYRTLYRQVAEQKPVEVPEPAPGAGRRFHGRG